MDRCDSFSEIHAILDRIPGLVNSIGMEKGMAFIRLATQLKDEIASKQKVGYDVSEPPHTLPHNVHEFLSEAIDIPSEYVQGCWTAFAHTIWQRDTNGDSRGEDAKLFKQYGLQGLLCETYVIAFSSLNSCKLCTAARTLFPPTRVCTNPDCAKQESPLRRKDEPRKVVLFTLNEGACATYSIHLVCHSTLHVFG